MNMLDTSTQDPKQLFDSSILSQTIRDLHLLHTYTGTSDSYEILLRKAIKNISKLLGYESKLFKTLEVTSESRYSLGALKLLFYVNKPQNNISSSEPSEIRPSPQSLLQHLRQYSQDSHGSISSQLIELLAASSHAPSRRLSQSYSVVLTKLSALLDFFIRLHRESEKRLTEYINKCFNYEVKFYSSLRSRLDSDMNINNEDTMQLVNSMEKIIATKNTREITRDIDQESIFEDDSVHAMQSRYLEHNYDQNKLVGFSTNDPVFNGFYQLFLQLCIAKHTEKNEFSSTASLDGEAVDFREYIHIMLGVYKKQVNTDFLELNDFTVKDLKFNYFYDKFLSCSSRESPDGEEALFPFDFREVTEKVAQDVDIFPEVNQNNSYEMYTREQQVDARSYKLPGETNFQFSTSQVASHPASTSSLQSKDNFQSMNLTEDSYPRSSAMVQELSAADQVELISNLKFIIPQLNDYFAFEPRFPSVMKNFITTLYDTNSDIFKEESKNYQYVADILSLLNTIIDYENDELDEHFDIQEVIHRFYNLHLYLTPKDGVIAGSTLLMRISNSQYMGDSKLYTKYFSEWNSKVLKISQLDYSLNNSWDEKYKKILLERYLNSWYNRYKLFANLTSATERDYQLRLTEHTFMNKWYKRSKVNEKLLKSADRFSLMQTWKKLRQNYSTIVELEDAASKFYEEKLKISYVHKILRRRDVYQQLNVLAEEFLSSSRRKLDEKYTRYVWDVWYDKMNSTDIAVAGLTRAPEISQVHSTASGAEQSITLKRRLDKMIPSNVSEKLRKLQGLEKYFLYRKYFFMWYKETQYKQKIYKVKSINDKTLTRFFLIDQWHNKYTLSKIAVAKVSEINKNILQNAFTNWKSVTDLHTKASEFRSKKNGRLMLTIWRLKVKEKSLTISNSVSYRPVSSFGIATYLKNWRLSTLYKTYLLERETLLVQNYKSLWVAKTGKVRNSMQISKAWDRKRLLNSKLNAWMRAYVEKEVDLNNLAILHQQKRYWNVWCQRSNLVRQNKLRATKHAQSLGHSFKDKITLKLTLSLWQTSYAKYFQDANERKVSDFIENVSNQYLLYRMVETWAQKYNQQQVRIHHMERACEKFIKRSLLKRNMMKLWKSGTKSKLELQVQALDFEKKVLLKKHLVKLYDEYNYVSETLHDMAEEYINQKVIQKASELLNIWSMKYIKDIKLQQSRCDMFIDRWQSSKGKSILEVWVYKVKSRRKKIESTDQDDADLADTSLTSNQSPLSKKANRSQLDYLNTPLKKRDSTRLPFTPSLIRVSPTKLQETSERIKTERVDKLIKHFQKAKLISSPDGRDELNRTRNADPGKILSSSEKQRSYANIIPPRPPNFKRNSSRLSRNIELSSDEESESVFNRSSPSFDEEISNIETAKSLRKITPIFVPTEDQFTPRFSPARKIKEGILNSTPK